MHTLVSGGIVVTPTSYDPGHPTDILIDHERIVAVAPGLAAEVGPAARVIDARGRHVLPGGVDPHTHLDLPVGGGIVSSDDFASGTTAAAFGGTTTIIDFPTQARGGTLRAALDEWHQRAAGRAVVDFAFHAIVCSLDAQVEDEIAALPEAGITSLKLFMAYPDRLMLDDGATLRVMELARRHRLVVCLHAENGHAIAHLVAAAKAAGRTTPRMHAATRPAVTESEAVHRAIALAEVSGATIYIVHVSTAGAVREIAAARRRGLPVLGETCPQYLCLDETAYDAPAAHAARVVMSPPLRPRWMQAWLWEALAQDDLQAVGTDHCPFTDADKARGLDDFTRIPNGAAGIETRLLLLHEFGVRAGRLTWPQLVQVFATGPARIFGLHPRKGTIAPGSDADLVVFDPEPAQELAASRLHMRVDATPYDGMTVHGRVETVISRGEVIVDNGRLAGAAGRGVFLRRGRP
jgi:dihydropyrimidinase